MSRDLSRIQALVGEITEEHLRYVDSAVSPNMGVFMPVAGPCLYATSPNHTHPSYSIVVAFDDYCQIRMGETILRARYGTMSVMSPGIPHQELAAERQARYMAVLIDKAFFEKQLALYDITDVPTFRGELYSSNDRIVTTLKEFLTEYEEASPGHELLLDAGCLKVVHLVIRQIFAIGASAARLGGRVSVSRAVEFIHGHYGEKLSVNDIAHEANLSASHFSRVFKAEMGVSPMDYLMEVRLDCAKRMLRVGEATISQIALECGFNASAYLSQCFAKKFGMSPSDFRKNYSSTQ
ncbi:MAG: helix-turn-helix domain-containing protein [Chitinivibrionales bacterium]|nr:helix-turn-helix domain-containing protein [Chitinivibrionales bacterium]MBD3356215.1 helix-turn-helix domain-containing protein [Chitinivibrionales bacterium]